MGEIISKKWLAIFGNTKYNKNIFGITKLSKGVNAMADYKKMYALLCGAIDDVLDDLNRIPLAASSTAKLQKALLDAEDMYIEEESSE